MADLYRKSSLEKLSNPEQLDKAIKITSPMSWLALLAVLAIIIATVVWSFCGTLPTTKDGSGIIVDPNNTGIVFSKDNGVISEVKVKVGDNIKIGDEIAILKRGNNNTEKITASQDGVVSAILVEKDSEVYSGFEVIRYAPKLDDSQVMVCYVPLTDAKQLNNGMKVLLYPTSVDTQKYGHMEASIINISDYAVSVTNMSYVVGVDNSVAAQFASSGPVVAVVCQIKTDHSTKSGFYWSSNNGKNLTISDGTYATVKFVVDECAPITKLVNNLKDKLEG